MNPPRSSPLHLGKVGWYNQVQQSLSEPIGYIDINNGSGASMGIVATASPYTQWLHAEKAQFEQQWLPTSTFKSGASLAKARGVPDKVWLNIRLGRIHLVDTEYLAVLFSETGCFNPMTIPDVVNKGHIITRAWTTERYHRWLTVYQRMSPEIPLPEDTEEQHRLEALAKLRAEEAQRMKDNPFVETSIGNQPRFWFASKSYSPYS